jgi:hypothetical protein
MSRECFSGEATKEFEMRKRDYGLQRATFSLNGPTICGERESFHHSRVDKFPKHNQTFKVTEFASKSINLPCITFPKIQFLLNLCWSYMIPATFRKTQLELVQTEFNRILHHWIDLDGCMLMRVKLLRIKLG